MAAEGGLTPGYVYLLRMEGYYKIGCSRNPAARAASFGGLPWEVTLVHSFHCLLPYAVENALHRLFADRRVRGEWFRLTEDDVSLIRSASSCGGPADLPFWTPPHPSGVLTLFMNDEDMGRLREASRRLEACHHIKFPPSRTVVAALAYALRSLSDKQCP